MQSIKIALIRMIREKISYILPFCVSSVKTCEKIGKNSEVVSANTLNIMREKKR